MTGASDDDPAGILTYTQVGARFGFASLWLALFSLPLMTIVQAWCARLAIVSRQGLTTLLLRQFPRSVVFGFIFLLTGANILNVAADLRMMASASQLLLPGPLWVHLAVLSGVSFFLMAVLRYQTYVRYLQWLVISLLAYPAVLIFVNVPWGEVWRGTFLVSWIPTKEFALMVVAFLGTTISPYLFFWQANHEREALQQERRERLTKHVCDVKDVSLRLSFMYQDVTFGMVFSNVVAWMIMVSAAAVFFRYGIQGIDTADQAAMLFASYAGSWASVLFAAGIIGTGLLVLPVLLGSAVFAWSEFFGWKASLNALYREMPGFYHGILLGLLAALLLNVVSVSPVKALVWSAIVNGFAAPPILFGIYMVGIQPTIMGKYLPGIVARWGMKLVIALMSVALLYSILA